ncbi:MAG TPA: RNA-guided pseudouridylation complex pseudouridine synthase subunit Cbf5 [Thermoplasmata archaeon]|nr:RNA-guided pseudouridylation complex pseudouridine synthase subunit Cbf5 [Thermoplasmata archaeon]
MQMVSKMKKKRLIKEDAETNPFFGKEPRRRSVEELIKNGVVVIDKPNGPTSHQVSAWVKEILHIKKAGHGGTLDPNVTGTLPVALQNATKVIGLMHGADKEYICVMRLNGDVNEKKLRETIKSFIGRIWQIPPKEAAVKRVKRERKIHYINIIEIDGRDVLFKVGCEGGTYIRVLCKDIGKKLGVGAYMKELRRTKSGVFEEKDAIILQDLLDAYIFWKEDGNEIIRKYIHPVETLLSHLPSVIIKDSAVDAICHGANLSLPGVAQVDVGIKRGNLIAIKTLKGEAVAIAEALMTTRQIMENDRGIVADIKRVIMPRGIYPPMWKRR